jgi:hypothetical protein
LSEGGVASFWSLKEAACFSDILKNEEEQRDRYRRAEAEMQVPLYILGLKENLHGFYWVGSNLQGDRAVGKARMSGSIIINLSSSSAESIHNVPFWIPKCPSRENLIWTEIQGH